MVARTPKSTLSSKTRSSSVGSSSVMSRSIGSVGALKSDTYCNSGTYTPRRAPHATNQRNNYVVNSKFVNGFSQSFSGVQNIRPNNRLLANSQLTTELHRNSASYQLKSSTNKIIYEHKPVPNGDSHSDRYSEIAKMKTYPGQGYTGWSTAVLGTGPFGWSDELLNVDLEANVGNSFLYVAASP